MSDERHHVAPPRPGPLVEALRGLGYSPEAAVADLVDNSISAGARRVELQVDEAPAGPRLVLLDDGRGMSTAELLQAMRLGALDPRAERDRGDLGRFGLGLKTASFSQCRRLTVVSRRDGVTSCLRWDLDVLSSADDGVWRLLIGPDPASPELMERIQGPHGTAVVWERLDRLLPDGRAGQALLDVLDRIEQHLGAVFQRFLGPAADGQPELDLRIQGAPVPPWDPFLQAHRLTRPLPEEVLHRGPGGEVVRVQGFVLPHRDQVSTKEWEDGAGLEGWTAQQGFYVYRNRRLLVAGGWLGLGRPRAWTRDEAHQLARIRVDLPNSTDAAWSIDVRKSRARPPREVLRRLQQIAEQVRDQSRKVFVHRGGAGPRQAAVQADPVWLSPASQGTAGYRINRKHPAVQALVRAHPGAAAAVESLLVIVESQVPVQRIWLDMAEGQAPPPPVAAAPPEVIAALHELHRLNLSVGLSAAQSRAALSRAEPFTRYPALVQDLPEASDAQ
jgi:hypothetical protein